MKKISDEQVEQIIHAIGVVTLAAALMDSSEVQKKKTQELSMMAAVVLIMHNGPDVFSNMIDAETDILRDILEELDQ